MLLIWYNPIKDNYYLRYIKSDYFGNYYIGKVNDYGHIIVQIFYYDDKNFVPIKDYYSYIRDYAIQRENSKRNKLINKLTYLLNKLRD